MSEDRNLGEIGRAAALTELVGLLESEDSTKDLYRDILRITGTVLGADGAFVLQAQSNGAVHAAWRADGLDALPLQFSKQEEAAISGGSGGSARFLQREMTGLTEQERHLLERLSAENMTVFLTGKEPAQYLCFYSIMQSGRPGGREEADLTLGQSAAIILESILAGRNQRTALADSYMALETVLEQMENGIYVCDMTGKSMLFANRSLRRAFRRELAEDTFGGIAEGGTLKDNGSYEMYHAAGNRWYEIRCMEIRWVSGQPARLYTFYDISDKKVYLNKIEQQVYTDFLTGLYNRMRCERDLEFQLHEAGKTGGKGALLYLDLDDFKHINEGLGHQYGDVLLRAVSHGMQQVRGISHCCYRMSGDEFVIIVPVEWFGEFERILQDIKEIFNRPWFLRDANYYCTMSMGVALFPDAGDNTQELLKKAGIAMNEAKEGGKNRVVYYSERIPSRSGRRLDMEKNMRDASVAGYGEFEVYYQPIVEIDRRDDSVTCLGAEALVRWNSSELGFIPPAEFIPLAEYLGLINPIGNHVLLQACRACKRWNEGGCPEYRVHVNLSVIQLLQPDIVDTIQKAIQETGIRPDHLVLEVTESLAINDLERMKEIITGIRSLGAEIALDDFGTGYSSLSHIREIPFDLIKIDQSFVKDLHKDNYSQAFIRMVTELADTIGVGICVEGVESREQYEIVKDMAIAMLQGYYFDRPMKEELFEEKYAPGKPAAG